MKQFQIGEEYAIQCLEKNGYKVTDRRNDSEYWAMDIDLTATKNEQTSEIEVKWDGRIQQTNTFFFELITDIAQNKQGWAAYTQSDFIFYGDSKRKVFYVFRTADMRQYLKQHTGEYETRIASDYRRDGTVRKQSLGAIIPIRLFCQRVNVQEIDIAQRLGGSF